MKKGLKIIKWFLITVFSILILGVLYLRVSRFSDAMIYQMGDTHYKTFATNFKYEEFYFPVDKEVKLHGVLFKPDSIKTIGTIFHYSGKGMHLMSSIQESYKPLIAIGFQVFCFERRNFGQSNGQATNSLTLQKDALFIFDKIAAKESVKGKPILIWGQSLGGAFATMTAEKRQHKIKGLILEGTFSSFPDIGKVYAKALHLENFTWVVPLIMNNDFPSEKNIKTITKPTVVIHSVSDKEVPYYLGEKLYNSANKKNTTFWKIKGKHIKGIMNYKKEYVALFKKLNTQ